MPNKTDFTPEEWTVLKRAPMMAGLVVVASSPSGPFGLLEESLAIGKILTETKAHASPSEVINGLVADLATSEGRRDTRPSDAIGKSPDQIKSYALDACRKAAALVDQKAPSDSAAFKAWLQSIGQKVAEAAKEGGFLGIGGTQVSDQEKAALTDLRKTLGVAA
jgi:hypothetical protein